MMQPKLFVNHQKKKEKMKKIALLALVIVTLAACKKNDPNSIIGTWKLIEENFDPGDGSGTFQPVDSDKTLTFKKNGTVTSNSNLCSISSADPIDTEATYNEEERKIEVADCFGGSIDGFTFFYEIIDGELIVSYPCFEGCQQKFIKE